MRTQATFSQDFSERKISDISANFNTTVSYIFEYCWPLWWSYRMNLTATKGRSLSLNQNPTPTTPLICRTFLSLSIIVTIRDLTAKKDQLPPSNNLLTYQVLSQQLSQRPLMQTSLPCSVSMFQFQITKVLRSSRSEQRWARVLSVRSSKSSISKPVSSTPWSVWVVSKPRR